MPPLLRKPFGVHGKVHEITPVSAGWRYVGFSLYRLRPGEDETMAVRDGDVVLVPRGHHPCGAPYGFEMYNLNVMAGPRRNWRFVPAPEVEWIIGRDG